MRITIFFISVLLITNIYPQELPNSISGHVTDKTTGKPLQNVNIFISGTNYGDITDASGNYEIENLPPGAQRLTFSLIGYESISVTLEISNSSSIKYNVELLPRIYSTETVEISLERPIDRVRVMNTFRELFLGKSEFAGRCIISNESKINVIKSSNEIISFSCDTVLTIINNSLGYGIKGKLKYFHLNSRTNEYECAFEPKFENLISKDPETNELWRVNREIAYRGSYKHFLISLYSNTINKEGFQLYKSSGSAGKFDKINDLSSIITLDNSGKKVLKFEGTLIIRYGLDISSIKLRYSSVIINQNGETDENTPFEIGGKFSTRAISELLPENYYPDYFKADKIIYKSNLHDQISTFLENVNQFQPNKYEQVKDSIRIVSQRNPKNTDLLLKYAAILERCCSSSAENVYEETIDQDSSCYEAFYRLGNIKSGEFKEYKGSIQKINNDFEKESKELINDFFKNNLASLSNAKHKVQNEDYSIYNFKNANMQDFTDAEKYFKRAIQIYPGVEDYYYSLANLYESADNFTEAIAIMNESLKYNNQNKDSHLLLGMLYFRNFDYEKSHHEYELALSLMSADEKNDFIINSAKLLLEPVLGKRYSEMNEVTLGETVKRFWQSEDPMLLTGFNERLLEHYSRVAYANLHFGNRKRTIPGWKTEQGEILLRYGFPKSIIRYRPQDELNKEKGLQIKSKTEVWFYDNMIFSFLDPYMNGEFQLTSPSNTRISSQFEIDSKLYADNLKQKYFEIYNYKPEGQALNCAFKTYQFKDLSGKNVGKTDVYFSLAIPGMDSAGIKPSSYKWGFYCFDSKFKMLNSLRDSLRNNNEENNIRSSNKSNLILVKTFSVDPQILNTAAEVLRETDNGAYSNHNRINVTDFNRSDLLMLSDIVISPKVIFGYGSSTAINRNGIWILPNPVQSFSVKDSVHIYYEIYNLGKDIMGVNDYEQEIEITGKDGGTIVGGVINGILKFVSGEDNTRTTITSSRVVSHNKNHQMCFQTNLEGLAPGEYSFRVKIKDKVSGQTAENQTEFNIY